MAGGQLFDDAAYVRAAGVQRVQQPSSQASPQSHLNGDQLKAFMTPREILGDKLGDPSASFQALDGDRRSLGKSKANSRESEKQVWGRKLDEASLPAYDYQRIRRGSAMANDALPEGPRDSYLMAGAPKPPLQHPRMGTSTFEELIYDHDEGVREHMANRHDQWTKEQTRGSSSLYEHVASQGVQGTVPLQHGGVGSQGKPQVLGTHHRLAAAHHVNPDQFVGVVHHEIPKVTDSALAAIKSNPYVPYNR